MMQLRFLSKTFKASGFIFPLVVLGILAVAMFVVFVHSMGSAYSDQVAHVDEFSRCLAIAESGYNRVLAMIRNKPYRSRFFAKAPYRELNVPLFGGSYNLYVVDAPGHPWEADIYIEGIFQRCHRLFFWRVKFENSLLDAVGRIYPLLFTPRDAGEFPNTNDGSPLASVVDDLIATRKNNSAAVAAKAALIQPLTDTRDIIKILDGPTQIVVAPDLAHGSPVIPSASPLTPPPVAAPTVILRETFDNIPEYSSNPIPGFTFIRKGARYLGAHTEHDPPSPPKCYILGSEKEATIMIMPLTVENRLIFEFDYMIEVAPSEVTSSPEGIVGFCDATGNFSDARNSVVFRTNGSIQFNGISPRVIGTWEDEKWVSVKVDLKLDDQTADVFVNGSTILNKTPIHSLANVTHFGIRSPANPTKDLYSNIDTLVLSQ
ncbi:MAG: hypothetical protein EOM80_13640 [Erysipelotrichia bacterium]|nr:hypothetical protein [Erysipelotrichia bacterium]